MDDKIQPGYSAPVEGEGAVAYETISGAVEAHNAAAQPGEPYWGISIADSTYRVYAYGAVPQPPTPEELAAQEEAAKKKAEEAAAAAKKQAELEALPKTVEELKTQNEMLTQCLMEMSEIVYA